ncbi:MAG TPA: helix-turn-helix transcriptional regulator [Fimbriimonadaceae bacterium]|nr:helix-turn-helix transcriptional regulator [Fimbriimonadaceae bacterium]
MALGKRIKLAAGEAGLTIKEVAGAVGLSTATLYAYIAGSLEPSSTRLKEIAQVTGKHLSYFTGDPEDGEFPEIAMADAMLGGPNVDGALALLAQVSELGKSRLNSAQEAHVRLRLGNTLLYGGRYHEAVLELQRARESFQTQSRRHEAGRCSQSLGFCYANIGLLEQAEKAFDAALSTLDEGDQWKPIASLVVVDERLGRFSSGIDRARSLRTQGAKMAHLYAAATEADIQATLGNWREAATLEDEALTLALELNLSDQILERLIRKGVIHLEQEQIQEAAECIGRGKLAGIVLGDRARLTHLKVIESMFLSVAGAYADADRMAREALDEGIAGDYRRAELGAYLSLAMNFVRQGQLSDAKEFANRAAIFAKKYVYAGERELAQAIEFACGGTTEPIIAPENRVAMAWVKCASGSKSTATNQFPAIMVKASVSESLLRLTSPTLLSDH